MVVDKRIPVSKERWEKLGEMKKAGQTYDDLLEELIQKAKRWNWLSKWMKLKRWMKTSL